MTEKREFDARTEVIAALNDRLPQFFIGGQVLMTIGVDNLSSSTKSRIIDAIQKYDDWEDGNDPYGERDFGSVEVDGEKVFFKIDAYDINMEMGSPDPTDPSVTRRVMTILLASEY